MRQAMTAVAAALAAIMLSGCGTGPSAGGGAVTPLAKAEGWRDAIDHQEMMWALAEVAEDRATAERAWEDNLPADLPDRDGEPAEPGRYGGLDDVDFDTQVLVVWSSGESGTCPSWLADVTTTDGVVEATVAEQAADACTDDYNPYVMLLAVDRDRLPGLDDLPADLVSDGITGGRVVSYPLVADE